MKNILTRDLDHILDHTRSYWEEMRGQRLFITGGTGFFGCWLLESLLWANKKLNLKCQATVLTRSPKAFINKVPHLGIDDSVFLVQGDIRTFTFPQGEYSHIIHAATEADSNIKPRIQLEVIINGTHRVLEFSQKCKAEKFLLTSSGAVYGKQPPHLTHVSEDFTGAPDPMKPQSAYGEGKRTAELFCSSYAHELGIQVKIGRCFALIGPYFPLDARFALGNFIRDGLNGVPITILGDGTPHRSYLYAADLAIWLWTILFEGQSCFPYNIGSETSLPIIEVANHVAKQFKPSLEVVIQGQIDPHQPIEHYVPKTYRANNDLKLDTWIKLPDAIKRTISFFQNKK